MVFPVVGHAFGLTLVKAIFPNAASCITSIFQPSLPLFPNSSSVTFRKFSFYIEQATFVIIRCPRRENSTIVNRAESETAVY